MVLHELARGKGVINPTNGYFHSYYTNSWSANEGLSQVSFILYLVNTNLGYPSKLCIYFGHHDPSSGKTLGHFQVLICRNKNHNGLCINRSQRLNTFSRYQETQACSMAWQTKVILLSYYKAFQNVPNWVIVFKQWQIVFHKPVTGLRCFIGTTWRLRVILSSRILFIPPQMLEINRWPIDFG